MDKDLEIIKTITEKLDQLAKDIPDYEDRIYNIQNDIIDLINVVSIPDGQKD